MRKLRVRVNVEEPLLTMSKSPHLRRKMVYIIRVNRIIRETSKAQKYLNRGSRIVYIGMTTVGSSRPSGSMSRIAEKSFELHGVKTVKVFILNSGHRQNVATWEQLESALLRRFKELHGYFPRFNKKHGVKLSKKQYHHRSRLDAIINELS